MSVQLSQHFQMGIESVQLSKHFRQARIMIDLGEGDTLFRHLNSSWEGVLTPRESTEAQR